MTDLVNHPSHYKTESGLEVIDMIEQGLEKYDHRDQVLKYVYRAPSKGNYLQDLQKAQWYLNRTVQNAIDGKIKLNELKIETHESFTVSKNSEEEKEPESEFDKTCIYTDSDGDDWGWVPEFGTWTWGSSAQDRQGLAREYANLGRVYADPNHLFAPYTKKVDAPKYDTQKLYKDRDGDVWEYISGQWVFGRDHDYRTEKRARGYGNRNLYKEFAPFEEIEDENGETV